MDWWIAAIILMGGVLLFLLIGVPVPYALGGMTLIGTLILWPRPWMAMSSIIGQVISNGTSFILLCIPMFILLAELAMAARFSDDAFEGVSAWIGSRVPGGLGLTTVWLSAVFAAVTGSSLANAVVIGRVSLPAMHKYGYKRSLAGALVASGGVLGILIPPSLPFIVYGFLAEESVGKLFIAGIVPGIMSAGLLAIYVFVYARLKPSVAPMAAPVSYGEATKKIVKLIPLFLVILFLIAGFYVGFATPSELGGVGAFFMLLLGLAYRRLGWKQMRRAVVATMKSTLMILWIMVPALAFAAVLAYSDVPQHLASAIAGLSLSPMVILWVILGFLLVMGCVLETATITWLMGPILIAVAKALGLDMIWFGVLFVISLELALITPPVGYNLFMMKTLDPDLSIKELYQGIWPFVCLYTLSLVLVAVWPQIALWLPNQMK